MLFRGENPNLGNLTTVKEVGASATSTATLVTANNKPVTRHIINVNINATNQAYYAFTAPWACKVVGIRFNLSTVSSDTTPPVLDVQKITADSTAPGSGTTLLAGTINLHTASVNTRVNVSLTSTAASLVLKAGDQIAVNVGGHAATAIDGALVQIEIQQIG